MLAVDGHGAAAPTAQDERPAPGHTFGTLSNLVLQLKVVAWDAVTEQYAIRTVTRADPEISALLVNLGRSFVTEVTLRVGANQRLRCRSFDAIPASALFAPPATAGPDGFAAWVERTGRVEVAWLPYTTAPLLKAWSVAPTKPDQSRHVESPYNYPFADALALEAAKMRAQDPVLTPARQERRATHVSDQLTSTMTRDLWGWSKDLLLYTGSDAPPSHTNGYAVLTDRAGVQRVVSDFYFHLTTALAERAAAGCYPLNGPVNIVVTGLDDPRDVQVPGALPPSLSAARPRLDRPAWDVVVWLNAGTAPGTPGAQEFYRDLEEWILLNYTGEHAMVRPEWSKGWGYTGSSAWSGSYFRDQAVPGAYRSDLFHTANWDTAVITLNSLDPHRVFTNSFLDALFAW